MMNAADRSAPTDTSQTESRWTRRGQHLPAEDPQPQERGLQEERRQALHGQRRAEHVADEPGVRRPVHPELELLNQTGDHTDRDVDQQQRAEEPGQPLVSRLPRAEPARCAAARPGTPARS